MNSSISKKDNLYISIIPINIILATILNLISISIFSKKEFCKTIIYRYLMVKTINDLLTQLTILVDLPEQCSTIFIWSKDYPIFFELIIQSYIFDTLNLLSMLINITIFDLRYSVIIKKSKQLLINIAKYRFISLIGIYILVSLTCNLPNIFTKLVKMQETNQIGRFFSIKEKNIKQFRNLSFSLKIIVHAFPLLLIAVITWQVASEIRRQTPKNPYFYAVSWGASKTENSRIKYNSKHWKSLKLMINRLVCSLVIVFSVYHTLVLVIVFTENVYPEDLKTFLAVHHSILICITYLNVFIYYKYNKLYAFYLKRFFTMVIKKISCL